MRALGIVCLLPFLFTLSAFTAQRDVNPASELQVHRWMKDLAGEDWVLQSVALEELGKRKAQQAAPRIRELLKKGKTPWIRGRAMFALGRISGREIIPLARKAARDEDPVLRISALRTLEFVGGEGSSDLALELMKDSVLEVRATAAALYAKQFPQEAWPTVEALTRQDRSSVSSGLLRALSHIGSKESLDRLGELFADVNASRERRREVIKALGSGDDRVIPLLVSATASFPSASPEFKLGAKLLGQRPRTLTGPILKALLVSDENASLASASSLMAEVCPTIELGDLLAKTWPGRELPPLALQAGMVALSRIDPARYEAFFNRYLSSEDVPTRAMAVACRSLVPDQALFETFRPFVKDPEIEIVLAALTGLRRTPEGARPEEGLVTYLAPSLDSPEKRILLAALGLLGERGVVEEFDRALELLTPILSGAEDELRKSAAEALSGFCPSGRIGAIAVAQGYVGSWKVVGPFANDRSNLGFGTAYGPEEDGEAENYKATYRWEFGGGKDERELDLGWNETGPEDVRGEVHLAALMPVPVKYAVAYARFEIRSDAQRRVRIQLVLREETAQRIWLNGEEVADYAVQRNELGGSIEERRLGAISRPRTVGVRLAEGMNRLVVKSSTFGGDWRISLRILDENKNRMADGIVLRSFEPPKEG